MITLEKIKTLICFQFIVWMLFTSLYSWCILGWKDQYFSLLSGVILLTDAQEIQLFQRERGGVRRIGNHSQRNIAKITLSKLV
ncbi:hypothetical protein [Nostoc sp. CMAA1605]|uniref:hypothetical protein n=1 Tax=Nostoc sp. CMAA1605 TaxID=2055159 RepID=UPI001F20260E|nr:hypothetical protein [Nostoc sp. CMAA1605]MCF4966605.1 hypothetical protein [Nostoc sp. CMAA1605]